MTDSEKWQLLCQDAKDLKSPIIIIIEGKMFVLQPASPEDVERISKGMMEDEV